MDIIKCGTKATVSGMECNVVACEIRFDKVTYQLAYFYQGEYKTMWLHESEFEAVEHKKQKIGFK